MSSSADMALDGVVIRARDFYFTQLGSPWAIRAPQGRFSSFHVLLGGAGTLRLETSQNEYPLECGGLVLLPWGDEHAIYNSSDLKPEPLDKFLERTESTDGSLIRTHLGAPPEALLICGVFDLEGLTCHPVYRHLPEVLSVPPVEGAPPPWLALLLEQVEREFRQQRSGKLSILSKLFDLAFYEILRFWMTSVASEQSWLRAARDPHLGKVLEAVHLAPERDWTVASLGALAGMSRSSFSGRFQEQVGVSPMAYVSEWKLWKARQLLINSSSSIAQIAAQVGFSCENALARAFRRQYRMAPSDLRKSR